MGNIIGHDRDNLQYLFEKYRDDPLELFRQILGAFTIEDILDFIEESL